MSRSIGSWSTRWVGLTADGVAVTVEGREGGASRRGKPSWHGPLIAVAATMVALLVAEITVRLTVAEQTLRPFANIYQRDPRPGLGYTLRPNYDGVALTCPLRTNALGFRGQAWRPEKAEGVLRIALLGDSHAFGYGVRFEETVGEQLATLVTTADGIPCEVLNFGVTGYNSRQQAAVFALEVRRFAPDVVIIIACNNDADPPLWVDDHGWMRNGPRGKYLAGEDRYAPPQEARLARAWEGLAGYSRLALGAHYLWTRYQMRRAAPPEAATGEGRDWMGPVEPGAFSPDLRAAVFEPLASILSTCRDASIDVIVSSYASRVPWRRMLLALGDEFDVPVVELLGLFPESQSYDDLVAKFSLGWDTHLGPEAHRRWAVALHRALRDADYVSERD
ncbi:MAG: hypothetical protein AAF628_12215 [Planctomycetota bacterium]